MTLIVVLAAAWAIPLILLTVAICRAAGRADRRIEAWSAERARAVRALEAMGDEADGLTLDFRPYRGRGGGWRI